MKAWYSADDILSGVQIYYPEDDFYFKNKQILGISFADIKLILTSAGVDFSYEDDRSGIFLENRSIAFYIPDLSDSEFSAKVEAVYISSPKK
jgi:hypothetical protein